MSLGGPDVLRPWLRRQRSLLWRAIAAGTAAQAIIVALPLLLRSFVHGAEAGAAAPTGPAPSVSVHSPWTFGILLGALVLAHGFFRWQRAMLGERMAQRVLADARNEMHAHLQRLARGYYEGRPVGNILVRFVGDANALRTWLGRTIIAVPADAATIVAVAVAVLVIDARLLLAAVVPLVLLIPVLFWLNPRARILTREGRRWQARLCGFLGERLPAMAAVQAANAQLSDRTTAAGLIERVAAANVARGRLDAWSQGLSAAAATAALGAVGLLGVWLHREGALGQGDLLAAVWLLLVIRGPIERLTRANMMQQRVRVAADRIAALLARKPEPGWSDRLLPWAGPGRSVAFKRLSYRRPSGRWLLRDLTAELRGPGLVAVVGGESRARSAVLELLLRVRRPHRGRISLDGRDIRHLRVADVRRRLGWMDRERRLAEVVLACSLDGLERHPGFDLAMSSTEAIAPGHPRESVQDYLSGRERLADAPPDLRLRLCAACALLEDPVILLLDEPTLGVEGAAAPRVVTWIEAAALSRLVVVATSDPRVVGVAGRTLDLDGCAASRRPAKAEGHQELRAGPDKAGGQCS